MPLYIVSTPIGNLGDITLRAIEILRGADVILAEDTRVSRVLLEHHGITTRMMAFHEHNEARATPGVLERLARGESVALISDAGTPLLSDPGARLVRAAVDQGYPVVPVPGASALLAALVASGLATDRFTFFGFLPRTGRDRASVLEALSNLPHTGVLFEAPGRVATTLRELDELGLADREVVVARELTKRHESFRRGTAAELAAYYAVSPPRGEVVMLVQGRSEAPVDEAALRQRAEELRATGLSVRDTAAALARELGVPRNLAYRAARQA
ncbi:MAG TPA: 16S rRNA (cytidine(1402)-2'-O)-methyltransferase [Gemmatimonadaceae bacterium]